MPKTILLTLKNMFIPCTMPNTVLMVPTQLLITMLTQPLITMRMRLRTIITVGTFITLIMTDRTAERITGILTGGMLTFS